MNDLTWNERQVAAALGMTAEFFQRQRTDLETAGLPPPIWPQPDRPGARNRRWSQAAVRGWIDRQVHPAGPAPTAEDQRRAERQQRLAARIAETAGGLAR